MANPMYGQNAADSDLAIFGRGKMNVITSTVGTLDLKANDSGSVIFLNDANGKVQLPAAEAGLQFKVILGIDTTTGAQVLAQAGDCFFGQIHGISTTDNKCSTQDIDYATAIATVASYDTLDFTHATTTLGGGSGDIIELLCIDATAWLVVANISVVGNPSSLAVINAT